MACSLKASQKPDITRFELEIVEELVLELIIINLQLAEAWTLLE